MSRPLSTLAAACDRHGVSGRAAASITTSLLQDMQMMSKDNKIKVIDRSKVKITKYMKIFHAFCNVFFKIVKN